MFKRSIALFLALFMSISVLPTGLEARAEGLENSGNSLSQEIVISEPAAEETEEIPVQNEPVQEEPEQEDQAQNQPEEEESAQKEPAQEKPVQSEPEEEAAKEAEQVQAVEQAAEAEQELPEGQKELLDVSQLESYIPQIVEAARDLVALTDQELEQLCTLAGQVEKSLDALSEEEKEELSEQLENFANAAAAIQDYRQVLKALENGTLDELEQSGKENSWRYQNSQPVEMEESLEAAGIQAFSAGGYLGIDVSHHNGTVNWQAVKDSGINFAIIRCGYGDDLPNQDDAQWERNVSECERLGIPYGVYLYSYATSKDQARNEARHALRLLEGHSPSLPVFIDYEEPRNLVGGTELLGDMAQIFCDAIQQAGYTAGVYGSLSWWNNYFTAPEFSNESWYRWIAHWGSSSCGYNGRYEMWQYTSDGSANGISGRVDMNYWYGPSLDVRPGRAELDSAAVLPQGVQLKWQELPEMETYRLYRKAAGQSSWSILKDVSGTSYMDTTAQSGKRYSYMVKAYKKTSAGTVWSDYDSTGLSALYLATPEPATLSIASNGMKITWNKITGATGYRVYRINENGGLQRLKDIATNTCTDTTVKPGDSVTYTVRAYRKENGVTYWGSYNKTGSGAVYMEKAELNSVQATVEGVHLSWDAIEGANIYRLYRQEEGQSLKILKDVTGTEYLDTTAQSGKHYTYVLKAYQKTSGGTIWSLYDKTGISLDYLAAPQGFALSSDGGKVQLSWQPVEGVTKYRVYRRSKGGSWSILKNVTAEGYVDTSVSAGETWEYTVRAYRKEGTRTIWSAYDQTGKSIQVNS